MPHAIRERVAGFDPAQFWQESPTREQLRDLVLKYERLAEAAALAGQARGPEYRALLIELSGRWPAALRESELIGPERVEQRRAAAHSWAEASARVAASSVERSLRCWLELHALIRDQLDYRRGLGPSASLEQGSATASFADWLGRDPARRPRWPMVERLPELVGAKLRVRAAYLWLAARAGLELAGLNALLFERAGHWDSRPDDPDWSR